jgi:hypothetical protein
LGGHRTKDATETVRKEGRKRNGTAIGMDVHIQDKFLQSLTIHTMAALLRERTT